MTRVLMHPLIGTLLLAAALATAQAEQRPAGDVMMQAISGGAGDPKGRHVAYDEASEATRGYLAMPEGDGPFPAVILIHEWNGLVDRIRQTADAFAEHGYIALAADLYGGRTGSSREENIALVREARSDEAAIIDNLDAAVEWLKTNTPTTGRIATVGWCFGGGVALSYALGGQHHDGTAIFYGSLIDDPERMAGIHHEVYGTFAEEDTGIPVDEVEAFVTAMRAAGIENDVHIYDAVDHGFWLYTERDTRDARPAAAHAWERLRLYLDRTIGAEATDTEEE
ncbi:MAG: hypothetical protein GVY32_03325 [Gammaproteobacteria bacterium]|nr:hypothetical protein [Gammaproteobacteria bacterium]